MQTQLLSHFSCVVKIETVILINVSLRGSSLPQASPSLPLFPFALFFAAEAQEHSLILTPGKQTKESPHKFIS